MLQLMSLSLDNWGAVHQEGNADKGSTGAHSRKHQKPTDVVLIQKPKLPLLSLMSLSLDKWGSKMANCSTEHPLDRIASIAADHFANPMAQVLPSESNLFDPRGQQSHSMSLFLESQSQGQKMSLGIVVAIVLLLSFIMCCLCWEGGALDDNSYSTIGGYSCTPIQEEERDFATVEFSDGSWAQVYREARGEQKEALELLFRCNIISTDEFAFSSVSADHIQECMWIATHMLRQKPLEEWVALWQQAQQTFEDSVTACFEARCGDSRSFHGSPPLAVPSLSLGAVPLSSRYGRLSPSIGEEDEEDEEDPYTTRSHHPEAYEQTPPPESQTPQTSQTMPIA